MRSRGARWKDSGLKVTLYAGFIGIFCCFFVGYFSVFCKRTKTFDLNRTYYLLCESSAEDRVETTAGIAYLSGAAGYVFTLSGQEKVALAAYTNGADAEIVAAIQATKGKETQIVEVTLGTFYFTDREQASVFEEVRGEIVTLIACADAILTIANGLENGKYTQEEGKRLVQDVEGVLCSLAEENTTELTAELLQEGKEKCSETKSGILYAKDLRYLQLMLIEGVYRWTKIFSI